MSSVVVTARAPSGFIEGWGVSLECMGPPSRVRRGLKGLRERGCSQDGHSMMMGETRWRTISIS